MALAEICVASQGGSACRAAALELASAVFPFAGPWGISYAINLTSDENTGMGIWSEEMFVSAMRTGRHMGQSRPIQPPMPWPNLARYTDEDLQAIFAYLQSLPPIVNRVPEYQPPGGGAGGGDRGRPRE